MCTERWRRRELNKRNQRRRSIAEVSSSDLDVSVNCGRPIFNRHHLRPSHTCARMYSSSERRSVVSRQDHRTTAAHASLAWPPRFPSRASRLPAVYRRLDDLCTPPCVRVRACIFASICFARAVALCRLPIALVNSAMSVVC
jgi:hypothetical protein